MKAIMFFSRILGLAIFCLTSTITKAQVQQLPGAYTTGNEYETAATASFQNVAVVAFQKPTLQVRLASYFVTSTGTVTLKDIIDLGNANKVNVTMLSSTRAILVQRSTDGKQKVIVFDLNATGNFTQKGSWTGPAIKNYKPGVAPLNTSSFATGVALASGALRLTTFTVNAAGTLTKKDDDDHGTIEAVDLAAMSATRFVAGVKLANDQLKVICFDVNSNTFVITRRGDHQWGEAVKRISMVRISSTLLLAFSTDASSRLDAMSFVVNSSGNFLKKDEDNDIKKPGTTSIYTFGEIDGQYIGSSKVLLSAIGQSKLHVVPFNISSAGIIDAQTGGYTSTDQYNYTYSAAVGGKLLATSRLMSNKYRLAIFKWN